MAIYIVCPECRNEYSIKHRNCPRCGAPAPRKDKTYRISVSYLGKRVRTTIQGSLYLAREVEAKIKQELISGQYYDRRKQAKQKITLNEFIVRYYLENEKNKKSIDKEKILIRNWIIPLIGSRNLTDLQPMDIEKIKRAMLDKGKSKRTVQYTLAVVKHILNKAKDWGYFEGDNPVNKVKMPKVSNRRTRFLTREEAEILLGEVKKRSQQTYEICLLSLYTGMRAGEIFNLKFGDIDLKNNIIHIKNPKSGEDRVAYITSKVRSIFENKKGDPDEYIFKDAKGNKMKEVSKTFFRAVEDLGLNKDISDSRDKVVFHTLRHTFASWLAIQGTPIYTIKELMGHKTLAMTERYSHLIPDTKREAVERLEKG